MDAKTQTLAGCAPKCTASPLIATDSNLDKSSDELLSVLMTQNMGCMQL